MGDIYCSQLNSLSIVCIVPFVDSENVKHDDIINV